MIGTKIGHYEITAKLGEGGMGEVWRATDAQLGREVALKLLPQGFTEDEERLARFEREAKVLASLNHPNIAQIYGFETGGDRKALVMELVEGPTLAERLEQGPIPFAESLAIARQIAEALEEAHEKGIVHRDLKPQNIKASVDGTVKVLDFGLAKAMDPLSGTDSTPSQLAHSPTLTLGATVQGVILGTAAYMAPEQAKGATADKRADIWAFGVVLFEMLAGGKLFAAETVPETLAQVLTRAPDLDELPADVPPPIRRMLRRCLERQPKRRLRDIGDARLVIDDVLGGVIDDPGSATGVATVPTGPPKWVVPALAATLVVAGAAAFAIARWTAPAPPPREVVRFDIPQPSGLPLTGAPKISPDGRHIAYVGRDQQGISKVWLRSLDSREARPLSGTDGVNAQGRPFWSPDSRFIAYFTPDKLAKVPIDGGPPQKIADAGGADGSWSEAGTILWDNNVNDPILGVPASGGVPRVVVAAPEDDSYQLAWPQFIPGGEKFLYVIFGGSDEQNGIWMANADGSDPRRVVPGLSRVEYAPPGWLLFVRESTLVAQRFDAERGELTGEPIPVADGLGVTNIGLADFAVSRNGVLTYRATGGGEEQLAFFDLKGARENDPVETGTVNHPSFSPDGRWLAYDKEGDGGNFDIWLRDLRRGVASRFTVSPELDRSPVFSPDGSRLYYAHNKASGAGVEIMVRPIGVGAGRILYASTGGGVFPVAVSPDERFLILADFGTPQGDLLALDLSTPDSPPTPVAAAPEFSELRASFSPDGRWLALQSDESGRPEIYAQPFPGPGRRWLVSTAGGLYPTWSPDGGAIYYLGGDQRLTRVEVTAGETFDAGVPEPLFPLALAGGNSLRKIALTPDGKRLLARVGAGDRFATPTSVVLGWDANLPAD